jgi:hypothetical protein
MLARAVEFWSEVEPPEPMRGLVVPPERVGSLGGGKRPRVTVTINGHSWTTRIAIMRGRNLIGQTTRDPATADQEFGRGPAPSAGTIVIETVPG